MISRFRTFALSLIWLMAPTHAWAVAIPLGDKPNCLVIETEGAFNRIFEDVDVADVVDVFDGVEACLNTSTGLATISSSGEYQFGSIAGTFLSGVNILAINGAVSPTPAAGFKSPLGEIGPDRLSFDSGLELLPLDQSLIFDFGVASSWAAVFDSGGLTLIGVENSSEQSFFAQVKLQTGSTAPTGVPIPGTLPLLAASLGLLGWRCHKRQFTI